MLSLQKDFEKIYVLNICSDEIKVLLRKNDELMEAFDDIECGLGLLGVHVGLITAD